MLERQDKEVVVDLHKGLCFSEFGRAITSLLEDLLYRTCILDLPVKHLHLVQDELTPRNKQQFERLRSILQSVERLASSGTLAEVVLLQGSTVPLAKSATHIRMHPALWDENTPRCDSALRDSILEIFRAVGNADLPSPKLSKSFLFVRLVPRPSKGKPLHSSDGVPASRSDNADETASAGSEDNSGRLSAGAGDSVVVEGFERRSCLPASRPKCRTVFCLRQDGEHVRTNADAFDSDSAGVWLQLVQHLPTVSCS